MGSSPPVPETLERKPLQTFLLHAAFATLLLGVLPALDSVYGYLFKSAGSAVIGSFGGDLSVEYEWVPPGERTDRGEIRMLGLSRWQRQPVWEASYSVRDRGYLPTATLVALVLATPATRRRKVLAGIGGGLALNAFYIAQTGLLAASMFATASEELVPLGSLLADALPTIRAFFGSPIVRYAAVFAVWASLMQPGRGLDTSAITKFWAGGASSPPS